MSLSQYIEDIQGEWVVHALMPCSSAVGKENDVDDTFKEVKVCW